MNSIEVFIENEAGSNQKNHFNEKTLEYQKSTAVSRAYPYAYGFILNTTSGDGDNLDCFVITQQDLKTGEIVDCEPIGVMIQKEDGQQDNNILAVPVGEIAQVDQQVIDILTQFTSLVFANMPGKKMEAGDFLGLDAALRQIEDCMDF